MKKSATSIPEVLLIEPQLFGDDRGFFMETYRESELLEFGTNCHFIQDNHSGSQQGVLRGLHYQIQQPQAKLIRVIKGEVNDVAVDIRKKSPTFGRWVGECLSEKNRCQFWIPEGFAHGFYVLSEWAEILYKTTNYYAPEWERTLLCNDPSIGIDRPLLEDKTPIMSNKDISGLKFS